MMDNSLNLGHAGGGLVQPREALARDALEIMTALFASFAEAIRVHNLVRVRQISRPLQDVAVLCDPVGLFVLLGCFVLARVLKI